MKILVTGASGLVGAWTLHRLCSRSFDAVGLVRRSSDLKRLHELSARGAAGDLSRRLRFGDLQDARDLAEAASDVSCIVHCAARVQDWGPRRDFVRDNVEGLARLLRAAASSRRLERFVLISTTNVEATSPRVLRMPYSSTKVQAESLADGFCRAHGITLVVLRPSGIYGPLDYKWSYRMLRLIESGRWPLIDGGSAVLTPLFVGNLLDGIERALSSADGRYTLTDGVAISWLELSRLAAAALGRDLLEWSVPAGLALACGAIVETCYRIARPRQEPPLTRYRALCASIDSRHSCGRACAQLGYKPDPDMAAHWKETVDWYRRSQAEEGAKP
jgi:2-alkyl-3-oxoalkanoate reductase